MNQMIRVVLVDPCEDSRQELQRLLGGIGSVWLAEVCPSYAAAARSVAEQSPDLTVVALDSDPEAALGLVGTVARSRPGAMVLPASARRDPELILRAIRAGAREFLTLPVAPDEILAALDRLAGPGTESGAAARRGGQVLAVTGAVGGAGCTTLAVNLAVALAADPEQSALLADFDLLLGSVDTCLDIIPDHTLLEVAQSVDRLDLTLLKRSMTRHASGLYVLPRPVAMEDVARIDPDALRRVLGLLRAAYTSIVLDTSKGLQASDFVAFETADTILLVVELDLICLRNSARLLHLLRQVEGGLADKVRVVANRAGSTVSEISLKKCEETLGLPVSWQIPNAFKALSAARARGVPLQDEAPGSRAHRAIQEIARAFLPDRGAAARPKPRNRLTALFF